MQRSTAVVEGEEENRQSLVVARAPRRTREGGVAGRPRLEALGHLAELGHDSLVALLKDLDEGLGVTPVATSDEGHRVALSSEGVNSDGGRLTQHDQFVPLDARTPRCWTGSRS